MLSNPRQHGGYIWVKQGVTLAVKLNFADKGEDGLSNRFENLYQHVPASTAGLIEVFLTSTDFASQIAFIGQANVARQRRSDAITTAREKIAGPRMPVPPLHAAR
jgi:hypothetical protein